MQEVQTYDEDEKSQQRRRLRIHEVSTTTDAGRCLPWARAVTAGRATSIPYDELDDGVSNEVGTTSDAGRCLPWARHTSRECPLIFLVATLGDEIRMKRVVPPRHGPTSSTRLRCMHE